MQSEQSVSLDAHRRGVNSYHVHADVQPVKFAQVFQLVTLPGTTQFVVSNDMFRLNYA